MQQSACLDRWLQSSLEIAFGGVWKRPVVLACIGRSEFVRQASAGETPISSLVCCHLKFGSCCNLWVVWGNSVTTCVKYCGFLWLHLWTYINTRESIVLPFKYHTSMTVLSYTEQHLFVTDELQKVPFSPSCWRFFCARLSHDILYKITCSNLFLGRWVYIQMSLFPPTAKQFYMQASGSWLTSSSHWTEESLSVCTWDYSGWL